MPVYFMQAVDGGPVKIGFSADVDSRREKLERHYGKPLAILATIDGGRDEEREVHERFSHLRLGRTEQFRPAFDLFEFIGRPLLVDPNPDAVELMTTPGEQREEIVAVRCRLVWKQWLEGLADHERSTPTNMIDKALSDLAKSIGYKPPPKR